jgi:uncharacterized protein (TIGR00369 family)
MTSEGQLNTANSSHTPPAGGLEAALRVIFEQHISFNKMLGLRLLSADVGASSLGFEMREDLIGNFSRGMLHGGVISAVLDVAGGLASMLSLIERHPDESLKERLARTSRVSTIDLRVDYLRPGIGKSFHTRAEILRAGSRVAVVRTELLNEEATVIASAVAAYTL